MSVGTTKVQVFWLICDACGAEADHEVEVFLEDVLAIEFAMEFGWTTDGFVHHCPDCPPAPQEVCS